jgi:predicted aconitase
MVEGQHGHAVKKSMEILVALGEIFGADRMVSIGSAQIAGVSYHNLGDAGLEFLESLAAGGGKAKVLATLNPAGMDLENWKAFGIPEDFAEKQRRVITAYERLGVVSSCTCTPYLIGNMPAYSEHVAWSESSAVTYANSVIGAKTNREGGPSALAAALTGRTPNYGMHLDENRMAQVTVHVELILREVPDFGALGYALGKRIGNKIPFITGVEHASIEELKSLSASIATFGGTPLFHIERLTPNKTATPHEKIIVSEQDLRDAARALNDDSADLDFVSLGCPHLTLKEIERIATLLRGRRVTVEFWLATSRQTKELADKFGFTRAIEASGAKFACDTCMAVAPLKGRFKTLATDSAKACYYGRGSNNFRTKFGSVEQCVEAAVKGKWS